jgi:hypothetical protein
VRTIAAAITIVLMSCLAACTSAGEPDAVVMEEDTEASTPATDGGDQPSTTVDDEPADLTDLALSLDDMPPGWVQEQAGGDEGDADGGDEVADMEGNSEACLDEIGADLESVGEARVEFSAEGGIPTLEQRLGELEDPDLVASAFAEMEEALADCTEIESTTVDGETFTMRVEPLVLPTIAGADDQLGVQIQMQARGYDVAGASVMVTKGTYATSLTLTDLGAFDQALLVELAETALAKLGTR